MSKCSVLAFGFLDLAMRGALTWSCLAWRSGKWGSGLNPGSPVWMSKGARQVRELNEAGRERKTQRSPDFTFIFSPLETEHRCLFSVRSSVSTSEVRGGTAPRYHGDRRAW